MSFKDDPSVSEARRRFHRWDRLYPPQGLRRRPKCSVVQFLEIVFKDRSLDGSQGVGRSESGGCEVHVDGNLIFQAFAVLGAGLAFLTFQAIKDKGRKRKRRSPSLLEQLEMLPLGSVTYFTLPYLSACHKERYLYRL